VFPGTSAAYTGRAYEDHWALDPWVRGAYSYYRVGQANTYGRLAGASEGRFLFAGSTPRSTTSASWTGLWKPVNGPRGDCCAVWALS
jgi:monoamine oxidase